MKIIVQSIGEILSTCHVNSSNLIIDCSMTKQQMFEVLLQFLEHITNAEWANWERQIDSDSADMVPCRHEFYQGVCAHCELTATEYRASKREI